MFHGRQHLFPLKVTPHTQRLSNRARIKNPSLTQIHVGHAWLVLRGRRPREASSLPHSPLLWRSTPTPTPPPTPSSSGRGLIIRSAGKVIAQLAGARNTSAKMSRPGRPFHTRGNSAARWPLASQPPPPPPRPPAESSFSTKTHPPLQSLVFVRRGVPFPNSIQPFANSLPGLRSLFSLQELSFTFSFCAFWFTKFLKNDLQTHTRPRGQVGFPSCR